jgi:hypothetical protein
VTKAEIYHVSKIAYDIPSSLTYSQSVSTGIQPPGHKDKVKAIMWIEGIDY